MPNWCENWLQVTGFENEEETQAFLEQHKGEGDLSFEKAAPYPGRNGLELRMVLRELGHQVGCDRS